MTAGYSKRSLVEKLGIKPRSNIAIFNAPVDFSRTLGTLPDGVVVRSKRGKELDFIHAFFLNSRNLDLQFPTLKKALSESGAIWISWPKKAARIQTDLTDNVVREIGLRHGLVDIKVCAVVEVWSGLKFVYRLKARSVSAIARSLSTRSASAIARSLSTRSASAIARSLSKGHT